MKSGPNCSLSIRAGELGSRGGSAQAYPRFLADDARLYREKTFPAVGKRENFAMLSQSGGKLTLKPDKAGISRPADLGYTYGTSRSIAPGSADAAGAASNYVHIWKRKGNRWTLVLDVESPIPQRAAQASRTTVVLSQDVESTI